MEENLKGNFNLISLQHGALNFAAISLRLTLRLDLD